MEKEMFKNIYPVLSALADGTDNALTTAVSVLKNVDEKAIAEEARKVLAILEDYKEPEIPFADITEEQIQRAYKYLDDAYEFVIWSSYMAGSDEDCARRVQADPECFQGMTLDQVRQIAIDACNEDRDDIIFEFASIDTGKILCIGTYGRWTGPRPMGVEMESLTDIFKLFTGDECTLYVKDGQLQADNIHHDGVDHFTFYELKDGIDLIAAWLVEPGDIDKIADSLVPKLDKHFGFGLCNDKPGTAAKEA